MATLIGWNCSPSDHASSILPSVKTGSLAPDSRPMECGIERTSLHCPQGLSCATTSSLQRGSPGSRAIRADALRARIELTEADEPEPGWHASSSRGPPGQ
jgi:hypothetical protein